MKLREILEKLDRSSQNMTYINNDYFVNDQFDIHLGYDVDLEYHGFAQHFIAPWYCTDTWVGVSVIYYKDEPVAIIEQLGRKCDRVVRWIGGKETYNRIYKVICDIRKDTINEEIVIDTANLDEEYGAGYPVQFAEGVLSPEVILKSDGKRYPVVKKYNIDNRKAMESWQTIMITINGSNLIVPLSDVLMPYRIKDEHAD